MAEDKRTIVILIRVRKQGFVMFPLFFCFMDINYFRSGIYETPPRNLDLQKGMCCIKQKEINLHMASPRLKSSLKDIKIIFLFLQTVHPYQ